MPLAVPRLTIADLDRLPDDGNRYELLDGILLVTPAPGTQHQIVLGRLNMRLASYLAVADAAIVLTPGVIQLGEHTQLEPDLLVIPAAQANETSWQRIGGWWLGVEVSGRDSRVYDRDFKRAAYLRLGVPEFWRLDLGDRRLYRSRPDDESETPFADRMAWHPPEMQEPLLLEVAALFG